MKNKVKIVVSVVGVIVSLALIIAISILAEYKIINEASAVVLLIISAVVVFVAIFYAAKIDYETGVYECRKCGHIFKPTFKAYIWGAHTLKTRHLKCPACKEKSWCRRKKQSQSD